MFLKLVRQPKDENKTDSIEDEEKMVQKPFKDFDRDRQADRRTDRQTDIPTDKRTDGQTNRKH